MICLHCGKAIDDDLKVCPFCGNLVDAPEDAPAYEAEAPADLPDADDPVVSIPNRASPAGSFHCLPYPASRR